MPTAQALDHASPSGALLDSLQDGIDTDLTPLFLLRYESHNTRRAYRNDLRQFFGSDYVTLRMARSVSFVHVNEHVSDLGAAGAKPRTIQRRVAALRTFYSWLIALGLLSHNPADRHLIRRTKKANQDQGAMTVLARHQAIAMLESLDCNAHSFVRDSTLLLVLLHCVLRRSEAAGMNFEHIHQSGDYQILELPMTKGGTNQIVKIPTHISVAIEKHRLHYGYNNGPVWRSLSQNSLGRRLSSRSIYSIVSRAAQRAGIEATVGAHTLRHTGCTLAIEAGATVQQVQSHARHKNIETTMMYVHHRDRLKNNAADFINLKGNE